MTLVSERLTEQLQSFQSRRRFPNWKATKSKTTHKPIEGQELNDAIVKRCLSFLPLEVQVGDWVKTVANTEVREFLLRNATDEEKHDKALANLATYYGGAYEDDESRELVVRWRECTQGETAVHPIVAAYSLEMGVFFTVLPALNRYGDVYASQVATWINDDERCHVETNLAIMKHLGLKLTTDIVRLVFDTVFYIFKPLGGEKAHSEAKRACKRLTTGKDPAMLQESIPATIAFFEQGDKRSIVY